MIGLVGTKLGMTQLFNADGHAVAVTVVQALPTTVLGHLTAEKNGYTAVKLSAGKVKESKLTAPELGVFKKAGIEPGLHIAEFRLEDPSSFALGSALDVSLFDGIKNVTVIGTSKGRGFAGTIKRHKFNRGPKTHGSKNYRAPGSMGAHTYPARVFPGKRLGGHMGNAQVTVKNLELVKIDSEKNLLFIRGAVPGPKNGKVIVRKQQNG